MRMYDTKVVEKSFRGKMCSLRIKVFLIKKIFTFFHYNYVVTQVLNIHLIIFYSD